MTTPDARALLERWLDIAAENIPGGDGDPRVLDAVHDTRAYLASAPPRDLCPCDRCGGITCICLLPPGDEPPTRWEDTPSEAEEIAAGERCATCGDPGMTMTQTWASTSGGSGETTFRVPWCAKHPPVRPNPSPGMVASCGKCGALPSEPCPEPAHCPRVASGRTGRLAG